MKRSASDSLEEESTTATKQAKLEDDIDAPITINVGGQLFTTCLRTLTRAFPASRLAKLFKKPECLPRDAQQHYFVDGEPLLFFHVMHLLRRPSLINLLPKGLGMHVWMAELEYWGLYPDSVFVQERVKYQTYHDRALGEQCQFDRAILSKLLDFIELSEMCYDTEVLDSVYWSKPVLADEHLIIDEELVEYVTERETHFTNLLNDIFTHHEPELYWCAFGDLGEKDQEDVAFTYDKATTSIDKKRRVLYVSLTLKEASHSSTFLDLSLPQ